MKIILSLVEAKLALAARLNSSGNYQTRLLAENIIIESGMDVNGKANYVESICRVAIEFPAAKQAEFNPQKIPAINRLRELTGIGIVEAKRAVERPDEAISTWIHHGKHLR
jgi:ribosomal protein L7/L12